MLRTSVQDTTRLPIEQNQAPSGSAGFGPILGAISRQTPPGKRSVALGITTAAGSFGQFAIVPFASLLQDRFDNWHMTMFILGGMSVGAPAGCTISAVITI